MPVAVLRLLGAALTALRRRGRAGHLAAGPVRPLRRARAVGHRRRGRPGRRRARPARARGRRRRPRRATRARAAGRDRRRRRSRPARRRGRQRRGAAGRGLHRSLRRRGRRGGPGRPLAGRRRHDLALRRVRHRAGARGGAGRLPARPSGRPRTARSASPSFGGGDRRSPLWLTGPLEVRRSDRSLVLVAGSAGQARPRRASARTPPSRSCSGCCRSGRAGWSSRCRRPRRGWTPRWPPSPAPTPTSPRSPRPSTAP